MNPGTVETLDAIIYAALRGELDETHARRLGLARGGALVGKAW